MKKYIFYTNTNEKYHASCVEFGSYELLSRHLMQEFDFRYWNIYEVLQDFNDYLTAIRDASIFDVNIKTFIKNEFNVANIGDFDVEVFEKFCNGEVKLLTACYYDYLGFFVSESDLRNDKFMVDIFNDLLSNFEKVTSPVGVVNEYEIVIEDDYIEGQLELITGDDLPF